MCILITTVASPWSARSYGRLGLATTLETGKETVGLRLSQPKLGIRSRVSATTPPTSYRKSFMRLKFQFSFSILNFRLRSVHFCSWFSTFWNKFQGKVWSGKVKRKPHDHISTSVAHWWIFVCKYIWLAVFYTFFFLSQFLHFSTPELLYLTCNTFHNDPDLTKDKPTKTISWCFPHLQSCS